MLKWSRFRLQKTEVRTKPGRSRKYGKKVDVYKMDEQYLKSTSTKNNLRTNIYQAHEYCIALGY